MHKYHCATITYSVQYSDMLIQVSILGAAGYTMQPRYVAGCVSVLYDVHTMMKSPISPVSSGTCLHFLWHITINPEFCQALTSQLSFHAENLCSRWNNPHILMCLLSVNGINMPFFVLSFQHPSSDPSRLTHSTPPLCLSLTCSTWAFLNYYSSVGMSFSPNMSTEPRILLQIFTPKQSYSLSILRYSDGILLTLHLGHVPPSTWSSAFVSPWLSMLMSYWRAGSRLSWSSYFSSFLLSSSSMFSVLGQT